LASVLYILLRYMSLTMIMLHTIWSYNFVMTDEMCLRINLAVQFLIAFSIPCVQGIMLMRVCAIYGPSRWVHKILKVAFVLEQVGLQTIAFLTYNGYGAYGIESTIHGYHNCNTFIPLQDAITAPWYFMQLTFETMMVAVSVFCLVRHAREVRRRHRRWDWNYLFATMIRDHTLYFVLYMVWGTMNGVSNLSDSSAPFINELLYNASNFWLGYIQQYILVPHLVLDVRERCDRVLNTEESNDSYDLGTIVFTPRRSLATPSIGIDKERGKV